MQRGLGFITRQNPLFKMNLVRVATQNFLLALTQQFESLYIVALGASPFQLGAVNSVGGLAEAAIAAPTGWLADRYGIRWILLLGTPLLTVGALLFALAPNWLVILLAFLIARLALRLVMTVCPMVCGSCLQSAERATGMQLCDTLSAIPRLVAPVAGSVLVTWFGGITEQGIRPLYYVQALGFGLVITIVARRFTDPTARQASSTVSSLVGGLREVLKQGTMAKRWLLYISLSTIPMVISPVYLPLYAVECKHADQLILGGMSAAAMVAPLALSLATGRLADTIGRKKVIYLTTPLYCTSLLLLLFAANPTMLLAAGVFQGFFMLSAVTQAAMTAELVPTPLLGRWHGLLGLVRGVATILTPVVAGALWTRLSPDSVFLFVIVTQLLKLLLLLPVPETLKRSTE